MADLSKIKLNGVVYNFKDAAVPAWAKAASKPTYTAAEVGATTTSDVNTLIGTAIGNINSFEVSIVTSLPTNNINSHTIYFVNNNGSNSNSYDEYMYINNNWEKIGNTDIDLSNYLQTTDIAAWAKASSKPTYTANEVGALPSTYTAPVTSVNGQTGAVTLSIPSATTVTNTLSSGTLIATINGTNVYAPSYTDADEVSY